MYLQKFALRVLFSKTIQYNSKILIIMIYKKTGSLQIIYVNFNTIRDYLYEWTTRNHLFTLKTSDINITDLLFEYLLNLTMWTTIWEVGFYWRKVVKCFTINDLETNRIKNSKKNTTIFLCFPFKTFPITKWRGST